MTLPRLLLACVLTSTLLGTSRVPAACDLAQLARDAAGRDAVSRAQAVRALRDAGPAGMDALLKENAALLQNNSIPHTPRQNDGPWQWLCMSMEEVGMARDAYSSGLFWYTSLDEAKAAAGAAHKPILSLRLLGNLTDELSCANSRYFRTVLYANQGVSQYLRENYILHWESVRNAPVVTISFGDGRTIERTITGNSIHYVLDPEGHIVDALPGLYGAPAFLRELKDAAPIAKAPANAEARMNFASRKAAKIAAAWKKDLDTLGIAAPTDAILSAPANDKPPTAVQAAPRAISKSLGELRVLTQIFPAGAMKAATDAVGWNRIAALHKNDAILDAGSLRLMFDKSSILREHTGDGNAPPMITAFTDSIALDTVRNEYLFHRTLCEWLAAANGAAELGAFNKRVYSELFLTPDNDPWLGLLPNDVYTAIDGDGVRNEPPHRSAHK